MDKFVCFSLCVLIGTQQEFYSVSSSGSTVVVLGKLSIVKVGFVQGVKGEVLSVNFFNGSNAFPSFLRSATWCDV